MKNLIVLLFISITVLAQNNSIVLDEKFNDWVDVSTYIEDPVDNLNQGVDFKKLWITNDDNYLYLRIDFYNEILIQEDTSTVILINTDNDNLTGSQEYNSGAEIKYYFGKRFGYFYHNNDSTQIYQDDIQLISAPTVSSTTFEICFSLSSEVNSLQIFSSDEIEIKFVNYLSDLDEIPDGNNLLSYTIQNNVGYIYPEYQINKDNLSFIRLLTYNVHRDDIFKEENYESYKRIFNIIKPDIIVFQEIYDHSSEDVVSLIEQFWPSRGGKIWYHAKINPVDTNPYNKVDVLVLSRYPIIESYRIQGFLYQQLGIDKSNSAHLIDIPNSDKNLLLVNAHTSCCQNNFYRDLELQEIMAFIKDAKTPGGEIDLETNSPIIIAGDMNLVGYSYQQDILIDGNLIDNNSYGPDFKPDWDETSFADAKPYSTGFPGVITWYNESEFYGPGRLDYIIYSDYTLNLENSYSLFTKTLSELTLQSFDIKYDDAMKASDHLPVVADFSLKGIVGIDENFDNIPKSFELYQNYPNPFNPSTYIKYQLPEESFVRINIYNLLGQKIKTLINSNKKAGRYNTVWYGKDENGNNVASGIYIYRIITDKNVISKKMILMK